ncbi:MAG: SBBP repeat-containing protein [bacterium]|nr:SBBP repeat-containing protein [bacterium]
MKNLLILFISFILPIQIFAQTEMWVARYDKNHSEWANTIAVDKNGNVYVAGFTSDSMTANDYATIKYNSSGDTMWTRIYNGTDNTDDEVRAMAIDDSGNVYVAGYSNGSGTYDDYVTIKYNSSGDTMWLRRYNGPGNGNDIVRAMTVDASGNVYVTGTSIESGDSWSYNYATIKYNSSGAEQWVRRYDGPGNANDDATAIAVDENGNVYVTGESKGAGTEYDYATIKYNSSGDTMWTRRYNGTNNYYDRAHAIAVDNNGNVYVTGESDSDYTTIKYNNSGAEQWVRRYDGPGNTNDYVTAIAVDDNDNVYVTGESYGLTTGCDYATIKYNSSGNTMWTRRYTGSDNDYGITMAVDNNGNVYVTGDSYDSLTAYDYATIKYNSSGDTMWTRRYNGTGNGDDYVLAMAVDNNGYVYVTGGSQSLGNFDFLTIKYSTAGVEEKSNPTPPSTTLRVNQNPFSKSTIITYHLSELTTDHRPLTTLCIYDLSGRCVKTLVNGEKPAGAYSTTISSNDLKTGVYFLTLNANGTKTTKKLTIIR